MRILALAILAIAAVSASGPARAQSWDPNYPVCMQVYGEISYNDCRYASLAQCVGAASGRAAQCVLNPYFANAFEEPSGRRDRRRAMREFR
jgi:glycerol uptake facilitator-like aquaporin